MAAAAVADTKAAPAAEPAVAPAAAAPAPAAKAAESGPKKAKDGKVYEAGALPNAWVEKKGSGSAERVIWMLTIGDPKPLGRAAGAAAAASTDSRMDPSTGLLFPDVFYVLGERVSVGKKDGMQLAKCFKGTANDTAEWPSGLVAVKCGRCDKKLEDGVMTIQKHMRLIGKTGEKKITCRMMPRLLCDACYQYACDATAGGAVALPAAAKLVAHKSYWTRWSELQPLVTVLSEDFVKSMSSRVGGGRTAGAMTTDEHGVQTVKLVKTDDAKAAAAAAAAPASLSAEQQQQQLQALLHHNLFTPSASTTPVTPAAIAAAASGAKLCGGCSKPESADAAAPRYAACGRCGGVWYCGKDCQKAHWKAHKTTCVAAK